MVGRRSDTRERIQRVALEMFAERGYEKTTLQEVAERLGITRPALYYHFKAKSDILASVIEDMIESMDDLIGWARAQPGTPEAQRRILVRMAELLEGRWRPLLRFAQVNQAVMAEIEPGTRMQERLTAMVSMLVRPDATPVRRFEARLAVLALILGSVRFAFETDMPDAERAEVAMEVATKLIAGQPGTTGR
ncbi:TetR/AcrR family transcriptional regulator [Spongiactinospora sp. TRM90649]|uniref:TetR/AcrR family transcriptional regulator n=1 Tax=Spongiactinospora sp. TRM90649 TaxID=3031114 RepID=UPI0023F914B5|nr:TetR/AcrR family transcriptional regulator [Spongiactinospora sp. TRM90649]MDF5754529.1 helix-turn-helix domain containing protein [Spongiactinospora sp. TRM90649]